MRERQTQQLIDIQSQINDEQDLYRYERQPMRTKHFITQAAFVGTILLGMIQAASAQEALWSTYRDTGVQQYNAGNYPEAERFIRLALQAAESFNPMGRRVATTLNDLARVYEAQGRFPEAEAIYGRSLS